MGRVLVVDDEAAVRSFLADTLESDSHEVVAAADGDEAWRLLERQCFDVVVTDVRMPGRDGMALLGRLRAEAPATQVVLLTAHGSVESAVQAMKTGAFDYLEKPLRSPAQLRGLVARALERRPLPERESPRRGVVSRAPPLGYGDPNMASLEAALAKVAKTDATVLLLGETGTGKELAARTLHAASARAACPFLAVNCAALSESLLESELFGHEKGAFTGAHAQRRGKLELAEGGTFFLDEIGELERTLQAKLLRVLQEGQFERLGGMRTLRARVRWVAATNRDLSAMVRSGAFREDLYHRLAVFPLRLPALRERPRDLRPLVEYLLEQIARELGGPALRLSEAAWRWLSSAELRGNIRELKNRLERAAILAEGSLLSAQDLALDERPPAPRASRDADSPSRTGGLALEQLERSAIEQALSASAGNRKRAAQLLGIGLRTLYEKLKRYELS